LWITFALPVAATAFHFCAAIRRPSLNRCKTGAACLAKKAKMPELDSFGGMFSVKIEADIAFVCLGKSLPFIDLPYPGNTAPSQLLLQGQKHAIGQNPT
jgi:hypothetical protein